MKLKSFVIALAAIALMMTGLISGAGAKTFRVACVMPSAINDYSWSQSFYAALVNIQEEMQDQAAYMMGEKNFEFTCSENLFQLDKAEAAIRRYAGQGYNLVIAHGSQYGNLIKKIAPEFPQISFCWGTGGDPFTNLGIKNVFGYTSLAEQSGFVMGALAGKLTRTGIIGWVGPVDASATKAYADGFKNGVKDTNPQARVLSTWTGSYSDLAPATKAAEDHISAGADVLASHAQIQFAVINACARHGVYFLGAQANQIPYNPGTVVASQINVWKVALMPMIKAIQKGKLGGEKFTLTLKNGGQEIKVNAPLLEKALVGKTIWGICEGKIKIY